MKKYLNRSAQLLGKERIESFESKTILVIGIGGVGGTALEGLARSGFKKFILIDCDTVDETNLNRQILFVNKDIGRDKVDVAKEHLIAISDDIEVKTIKTKIGEQMLDEIISEKIDFIVDAIDFVEGKLHIFEYALKNEIPFISSLGMGNRIDPEKVTLLTLNKTENDPLAKKIRYLAKQKGFDLRKIPVVFSSEVPLVKSPKPTSMIMVPSTAGLLITKYVLNTI